MKSLRRFARLASGFPAVLLILAAGLALAQEITGSISGTITDPTGAFVKGATVTLTNTDRNQDIRTLTTNDAGLFTAPSLPLGTYNIKITAPGFKTETVTHLVLHVNDTLTVNRQLAVGNSTEEVTVQAESVQLNFQNATTATLISGTQIRELTLNNRNYEQLVALQPGVAYGGGDQLYIGLSNPSGETNVVSFSINGNRNSANNWTLDGADNVDRGSNLTLLAYPSIDAIAEFKTQRGTYSAEYGRSASGQINVVTRSGTNSFHGTAYEFFRNNVFNANSYINNMNNIPRPVLRYNDFGYAIGGPVWIPKVYDGRDKTFFFFSHEIRRVITYTTFTNTGVPTLAERQGNFGTAVVCASVNPVTGNCNNSGTTQISPSSFSPTAQAYLKDVYAHVPAPGGTDGHTLITTQRNIYNQNQQIVRIDQTFGSKVTGFFRFINDALPTVEPGGLFSGTGYPGVQTTSTNSPGRTYLGHVTYVFNPRLLVDAGYAYSSGAILSDPTGEVLTANSPDVKPTLPFPVTLGRIPALVFCSASTPCAQGVGGFGPYRDYNRNHNVFGNLSKAMGRHSLRIGATYNHYQKTENNGGANQGTFTFSTDGVIKLCKGSPPSNAPCTFSYQQAFANFLTGFVNNFNQASLDLTPSIVNNTVEIYGQDDWKVTPRLTWNLGVRYSFFPQPVDTNNMLTTFDPTLFNPKNAPTIDTAGNMCIPGAPCKGGVQPNPSFDSLNGISINGKNSPFGNKVGSAQKTNFAPRVGFAYDLFGDGKAALRGGYGIAYDTALYGIYEQNIFQNPPFVQSPNITNTSFDNPAAVAATLNTTPVSLHSTAVNFKTPYTQQFSLDLQQQLAPNLVLDMGYFGVLGRHLLGIVDLNEVPVGAYLAAGLGSPVTGDTVPRINTGNTPTLNQIRPYKGYVALNTLEPWFTSNYHSLQIALQKRFRGNSLVDVNYTWSRSLTTNQTDRSTAPQNTYNIAGEYGRSQLDRNNILTANFIYELPFLQNQPGLIGRVAGGWQFSGIVSINSGLPLTATISNGIDPGGLGILGPSAAGTRPDQIDNPNSGNGRKTFLHWFNTAAFAPVPAGVVRPGNARRGTINGPGFQRWDLSVFKNFRVTEGSAFQFRVETTNTFNHTNFDTVSTSTTSSLYGQVTGVRDPRILQLGLKFTF